jgi:hypothetical protein
MKSWNAFFFQDSTLVESFFTFLKFHVNFRSIVLIKNCKRIWLFFWKSE